MGLVILRRLFRHLLSEWQLGCRDSTREREQRTLTEVEAAKKKNSAKKKEEEKKSGRNHVERPANPSVSA